MIERFIDYMQFSSRNFSIVQCLDLKYASIRPVKNYNQGFVTPLGFRVFFSRNQKNTPLLIASGSTMQNCRDFGMTDEKLLAWAFEVNGKFSRLDLAVTECVTEHELEIFTMEDVKRWIKNDLIDSPLVVGGQKGIVNFAKENTESGDQIETIYIGDMEKRAKRGIFRAYDKGIQIGTLAANLISRIELELKRDSAQATAKRLLKSYDIAGNFRAKFDVRDSVFERIMQSPATEVKRGKGVKDRDENEALDKRWQWLIDQVAPSLRRAIADDQKLGRGDARMLNFLSETGLLGEMREYSKGLAKLRYNSLLMDNGLIDISKELW